MTSRNWLLSRVLLVALVLSAMACIHYGPWKSPKKGTLPWSAPAQQMYQRCRDQLPSFRIVAGRIVDCREFTHSGRRLPLERLARQVERFIVDHPIPGFAIDKSAPGFEYSSRRPVLVPSIQPTIAIVAGGVGLSDLDQYPAVNAAKAGAVAVFSNVFPCPDPLLWFSPDLGTKPVEVVFAGDTATISWSGQALVIRRHDGSCMTSRSGLSER